jgi:hypothetical protein
VSSSWPRETSTEGGWKTARHRASVVGRVGFDRGDGWKEVIERVHNKQTKHDASRHARERATDVSCLAVGPGWNDMGGRWWSVGACQLELPVEVLN